MYLIYIWLKYFFIDIFLKKGIGFLFLRKLILMMVIKIRMMIIYVRKKRLKSLYEFLVWM